MCVEGLREFARGPFFVLKTSLGRNEGTRAARAGAGGWEEEAGVSLQAPS